ncbi:MAG: hypothetical protein JKY52_09600 [Flavobacteriales bacterium]|nr:hypothetical protein [Flavobacteriales bacterium]
MEAKDNKETIRMKLWKDVAVVVAGASNSTRESSPARWADEVLKGFDKRFPEEKEDEGFN